MKLSVNAVGRGTFPFILIGLLLTLAPASAQIADGRKNEIRQKLAGLSDLLGPSAKPKLVQASRELGNRIFASSERIDIRGGAIASVRSRFPNSSNIDIETLAALVMFDLWQSEESDLREILDEMEKMNQMKQARREYLESLKKRKADLSNLERARPLRSGIPLKATMTVIPEPVSSGTARTRLLNVRYTVAPRLPALKDPGRLSAAELDPEIAATENVLRRLEETRREAQTYFEDFSKKIDEVFLFLSQIVKLTRDQMAAILRNISG